MTSNWRPWQCQDQHFTRLDLLNGCVYHQVVILLAQHGAGMAHHATAGHVLVLSASLPDVSLLLFISGTAGVCQI